MVADFQAIRAEVFRRRFLGFLFWGEVQRISSVLQRKLHLPTLELVGVFLSAILTLLLWKPAFQTPLMAYQ